MSLNNIGISYSGSYLLQGNQIERLKKSLELKANTTELLLRTDKKECDIDSLRKVYNGNILFHVPAINPDLANLKIVNEIVRNLKENKSIFFNLDEQEADKDDEVKIIYNDVSTSDDMDNTNKDDTSDKPLVDEDNILSETKEQDLFNLIDNMYSSEDDEEDDE